MESGADAISVSSRGAPALGSARARDGAILQGKSDAVIRITCVAPVVARPRVTGVN